MQTKSCLIARPSGFPSWASGFCPSFPNRQVRFFGKIFEEIQIVEVPFGRDEFCFRKTKEGWGLVKVTFGLVFHSWSLPEGLW